MKRFVGFVIGLMGLMGTVSVFAQTQTMTMEECVDMALEQNADILRGEFTLKIAGRDIVVALSEYLPSVNAWVGYSHSVLGPSSAVRVDPGTGIPIPLQPYKLTSWATYSGFQVNQTLLDVSTIGNIVRSRQLYKSAEYTFKSTRQTTILTVKERYYNLLASEKLLEVARETLNSSTESYKRAQVLYEVGKAPKSDVLQAKVQMETDRLSLIQAENNFSIARGSLNYILGLDVDQRIRVVDNLEVPEIEISYESALDNAFSFHPDLLKAGYDVNAARAALSMAVGAHLPRISASFSYSWRNAEFDQLRNYFDTDYNYAIQTTLRVPVFSGLQRLANVSRAQLNVRSYRETEDQTRRSVALETQEAYFNAEQAKKQIAVARNAVEAAEEVVRLNRERYNLGAGTMLDLINAQVSLSRASSDHIQALYNYKTSIARLEKAMGQLDK